MKINYRTGLAMAAGLMVMAAGAQRIHAAVTQMSTDVPKAIIDLATVTSTLNFTVNGTTTDVDVANLNITHTWQGDVDISLSRPGGALVAIFTDCGQGDDNFVNVSISDEGLVPTCTANGNTPHTGPLRGAPNGIPSATIMQSFNNISSGGVWTMSIFDDFAADSGTLTTWGIAADGPPPLPVELMKMEIN